MTAQERLDAMAAPLLAWYEVHQRTLPWRGAPDPYAVWVSEIMLQQTRVAAVIPYYARFMEALPTVAALAAVEEERLLKLWEGLGYYSRARNLKKAAQVICDTYGGVFPNEYKTLLTLPGVGDYTAGAIASIAFGEAVPAVDGNVLRVAARVGGIHEDILDPKARQRYRDRMVKALPQDQPGAFNQALMDLGAMVCLPGDKPACGVCPLAPFCAAKENGQQAALPVRRKKAPRRVEELTVYLLINQGRVALRKREAGGLLAGLWEFPHVSGIQPEGTLPAEWGLRAVDWRWRIGAKHIFTHVEWRMTGYMAEVQGEGDFVWAGKEDLEGYAIPSAFAKYLAEVKKIL